MDISALKSQSLGEYISLFSNPLFLKAVKTAANKEDNSGKYDALLANLEKLTNFFTQSHPNDSSPTIAGLSISPEDALKEQKLSESLEKIVDKLIANADLLESQLNLDVIPPDDNDLFDKFLAIFQELDKELRLIQKNSPSTVPKVEHKLKPSNQTESGFEEGITLLAV